MRPSAFWDASALVPLLVREPATRRAIAAYNAYEVVVWWATGVEISSAFARLVRMKQLDADDWNKARQQAKRLEDSWLVIQPTEMARRRAIDAVEAHDLSAADALQLAAALEWCEDEPQGRIFLTLDQKLRGAALLSGFDVRMM